MARVWIVKMLPFSESTMALLFGLPLCAMLVGCHDGALREALLKGDEKAAAVALANGANPNTTVNGSIALVYCIKHDLKLAFEELLSGGADPNRGNRMGFSAIDCAAGQENSYWMKRVLECGGDPNSQNKDGLHAPLDTPLIAGVWARDWPNIKVSKSDEAISMLLKAGADPNMQGMQGRTPFRVAITMRRYRAAAMLIRAGADPFLRPDVYQRGPFSKSEMHDMFNKDPDSGQTEAELIETRRELKAALVDKGFLPAEEPPATD